MNLQKITAEVNQLVLLVGDYILKEREGFNTAIVVEKGLNQLVSFVDIEAEKQLVAGLSSILPEAGFITEENTVNKPNETLNWIIDPLDGTTNFIHNLPIFSISIALMHGKDILVGVVYELGKKDLFTAWQNGGAWCNGIKIEVSKETMLSKSLIATGFPYYDFDQMEAYLNTLKFLMKETHGLRRLGSAAVDLAYVACGKFEGFFEYGLHPWDVAAGCLLVKEAGGFVCDFEGDTDFVFGKTIIAGNASTQLELQKLIAKNFLPNH